MYFDPIKVSRGGRTPGTYVCPEVVVAYGMWISPQFALKVIRMFLKLDLKKTYPTSAQTILVERPSAPVEVKP
jgi:hypothetical protein